MTHCLPLRRSGSKLGLLRARSARGMARSSHPGGSESQMFLGRISGQTQYLSATPILSIRRDAPCWALRKASLEHWRLRGPTGKCRCCHSARLELPSALLRSHTIPHTAQTRPQFASHRGQVYVWQNSWPGSTLWCPSRWRL